MIEQTANILFFVGTRHRLAPKADAARLRVHQLQLTMSDFILESHDTHHPLGHVLYYEQQIPESRKRSAEFRKMRTPKYFGYFERILKQSGGYLAGRRLSYADLSLFQIVEGPRYAFPKMMKKMEPIFRMSSNCMTVSRPGPISAPIWQAIGASRSTRAGSFVTIHLSTVSAPNGMIQ